MRVALSIVLAAGVSLHPSSSRAQNLPAQNDSAAAISSPSIPGDDPAFAGFLPVTKGIKPPKAVSAPDPKYPDIPADAERQGIVVMLIGVTAKGHVEAVRVVHSDEAAFEKTAVETVKKWKFKPAQKDGHAVPVQVTVEMKFER